MTKTARLYGGSLYDLTAEEGCSAGVMEELEVLGGLLEENPDYLRLLGEPSIPKAERLSLLDAAFGGQMNGLLLNFLKLLCENGLLRELKGCAQAFETRYNEDHNIARAVVTSAVPLTEEQLQALTDRLERISGKQIRLKEKQDGRILGGLRVELEGRQFDGTLEGRLDSLRRLVQDSRAILSEDGSL